MSENLHELLVTGLAYGGEAIGRLPAPGGERVVFVPFALPGERVRVRLVEERRGFARAELVEVLEPAALRLAPRCRHFGACGGCHYQHMPYEAQLEAKTAILRDQLQRIGHIEKPPVRPAVPSPEPWNYRNHVQFHITPEGRLGYVAARSSEGILAIQQCHLPQPALNNLWPQLELEPGLPVERISIRQGADEELLVLLESSQPDLPGLEIEAGISVVHGYGDHAAVMAGRDHILVRLLGRQFRVSAQSFFQVNTPMAERMVEHVMAGLDLPQRTYGTLLDVYCGAGLFSAFLAPHCERLVGIESSPSACEDFVLNLDEFDNVELYEDRAERALPALQLAPDVALVDPPRSGLEPAGRDALLRLAAPTLVYVSCDPSTLARDARRLLDGGYRLLSVTPFDLFPQTYHIESIGWFAR